MIKKTRIYLFMDMLRDTGYDDLEVAKILTAGVDVVGLLRKLGI